MDFLVAILFYLNMLMPGVSYTQTDLNAMIQANQQVIMQVQSNPELMKKATNTYTTGVEKGIVEPWEEEREPIQDQ